jgi:Na+/proline symporter
VRSGVSTDVEFYELRYSGKPAAFLRGFRAIYLGVFFNVLVMGNVLLAAVKIAVVMFGVSQETVLCVTAVSSIVYSAVGGMRGIVYTDFFLFIVIMIGAVVAMVYAVADPAVGGFSAMMAHESVSSRLSLLPDFSNTDQLMACFAVPLAVQWWSVWKAGSEPGGGGYIVQRVMTARSESHALGGTLFFNVLNWAIRPWPWYVVAFASLIVFPDLESIRRQFPSVNPALVGGDMAYPAMLTKVPPGWLGVVVASLMGALFSTMAAHLNMGSAYFVNDFWRRFVRPGASERESILIARFSVVVLLVLACLVAPHLKTAKSAFDLMFLVGAGTGPVFLLRWFWMRVNAWSEVSAMIASALGALAVTVVWPLLGFDEFKSWERMCIVTAFTTCVWITVTLLTPRVPSAVIDDFCRKVRSSGRDVGRGVLQTAVASVGVFASLFAVAGFVRSDMVHGVSFAALAAISFVVISITLKSSLNTQKGK